MRLPTLIARAFEMSVYNIHARDTVEQYLSSSHAVWGELYICVLSMPHTVYSYLDKPKCKAVVVEHLPPMQASHQCGPGSIPGLGAICGLSLLLVLVLAPRGFSPGTPVFPSSQKPTLLNSNSIWKVPRLVGLPRHARRLDTSIKFVCSFYLFFYQSFSLKDILKAAATSSIYYFSSKWLAIVDLH